MVKSLAGAGRFAGQGRMRKGLTRGHHSDWWVVLVVGEPEHLRGDGGKPLRTISEPVEAAHSGGNLNWETS